MYIVLSHLIYMYNFKCLHVFAKLIIYVINLSKKPDYFVKGKQVT
jgi:hypothetical protein